MGAGAEAGRAERVWCGCGPSGVLAASGRGCWVLGSSSAHLAVVEEPGKEWFQDLRFLLSLQGHGAGSKSELRRA